MSSYGNRHLCFFLINKLGIGLTDVDNTSHHNGWDDYIRENRRNKGIISKYCSFGDTSDEIVIKNNCFKICGSMGSSSKPEIKITFGMK